MWFLGPHIACRVYINCFTYEIALWLHCNSFGIFIIITNKDLDICNFFFITVVKYTFILILLINSGHDSGILFTLITHSVKECGPGTASRLYVLGYVLDTASFTVTCILLNFMHTI